MTTVRTETAKLNIRSLKQLVSGKLPRDSLLRRLILTEEDEFSIDEFIIKIGTWLKMLKLEAENLVR